MPAVRTQIVRIGNSQGVRIPRAILEQCRLEREVWLEPATEGLVVRPVRQTRAGWETAFQEMAEQRDDGLLDQETLVATEWEEDEWEWR